MERNPWQFYKADIDGNGRTDLVIDAGIVVIVMDMGGSFEGHTFSDISYWNSYGFKQFIHLPDGATALVLRHDHNPWSSVTHNSAQGKVTYVTNEKASRYPGRADTLYKITTGMNTEWQWNKGTNAYDKMEIIPFADTVDMRLYNMTDTIIYMSAGFTNYLPDRKPAGISKISYLYYVSGGITGERYAGNTCLEINKGGKCFLQRRGWMYYEVDTVAPVFYGTLSSARLKKLWDFTSYIDLKSKEDNYREEVDHSSGGAFAVQYDDGTIKKIRFWAFRPPMDLGYLSKALSDISEDVDWQQLPKGKVFECPCK